MSYVRCLRGLASGIEYPADRPMVGRGDDVVVVNTGSLEKYLPALRHLL